jgi:hypothetical protein
MLHTDAKRTKRAGAEMAAAADAVALSGLPSRSRSDYR